MQNIRVILGVAVVVVVTAAAALATGRFTNRWGTPPDLDAAAQRLVTVPTTFGAWQSKESHELTKEVAAVLQCPGYVNRNYTNQRTGEQVEVIVLVGPAGPISVHTPDICYTSRQWKIEGEPKKEHVRVSPQEEADLWSITLRSQGLDGGLLRVYYAWSNGQAWTAPDSPRLAFRAAPLLYKIQIAAFVSPTEKGKQGDSCRNFLVEFLPALRAALVEHAG